ncbi:ATP-binding protein [Candidatus Poriferisodalis sp.]|uniref:ATP-binding protein n=1 Tax=Candidatus Poriferisodalis sp. TaxID=3101277 RepID=UPI003B024FF5
MGSGAHDGYLPRIADGELDVLCAELPAVALEGPRAVGKTETALRRATTVHRLDDVAELDIARADPSRLAKGEPLVLIDEWQRLPASWDVVRRAVDADPRTPRFLLTGSAAPAQVPTHSGAGRIVTVRLRPLSLAERGLCTPTVSLGNLLAGSGTVVDGASPLRLEDYAVQITGSGFPGLVGHSQRASRAFLDGYLDRIAERHVHEQGRTLRNRAALRRWMAAYAAATSTTTTFEQIRDAASPGEADKPTKATTIAYRAALEGLWLIEELPAWLPVRNHLRRLASAPVHQFADPALAARLLETDTDALLAGRDSGHGLDRDSSLLGALFESLVTLSVRVYAQANEAKVFHLRTQGGEHEIDLIVQGPGGRIVAVEVKLTQTASRSDTRHLRWLAERIGPALADAAVITTGPEAYRRPDGIAVIPAALLTA